MKKTAAVIAALLLTFSVILSACTNEPAKPEDVYKNADGFEAELSVKTKDSTFDFTVSRLKPDYFELNFTEPELLKNFTVIFNGNDVKLKYYGFELSLNRFPIPIEGGISKIIEVLKTVDNGFESLELRADESGMIIYDGEGFNVTLSPDSLLPISFEISLDNGDSYYITVKNFKLLIPEASQNENSDSTR
ncbi:MAG: hypothetical protein IKA51_00955 [Clostridia bacterium]|nr:hypothetical protein [Clostridia bacterium]